MKLTHAKIAKAKPKDKPYRLYDGQGLYLEIRPSGSKLWRYRFKKDGKERLMALGEFPEVTLAQARLRRDRARLDLRDGLDPIRDRRRSARAEEEEGQDEPQGPTFPWS